MKNWVQLVHLVVPVSRTKGANLTLPYINYADDISLEMVVFFSGADAIPPMGYPHEPLINFNPESPFPTASTCTLQLTLPTCYTDYGPFKHALNTAFTMHGGFGMS